MPVAETGHITPLLERWFDGDKDALDELVPLIYQDLRRLARRRMALERAGHTFNSTVLVHELFLRLFRSERLHCHDRAHFLALCARLMRNILVDHARTRRASKRGSGVMPLSLDLIEFPGFGSGAAVLMLDQLLERLAQEIGERKSQVLEMRVFGGLTGDEIASELHVALSTVKRDLRFAKSWMKRELSQGNQNG